MANKTFIKKFEIVNYRSCLNSSLDLKKDLTCLIGINGVGKTNLLSGLQLLKKIKTGNRFVGKGPKVTGSTTSISVLFSHNDKEIKFKCDLVYETDDRNYDEILGARLRFSLLEITGSKKWLEFPAELLQYFGQNFTSSTASIYYRNIFNIKYLPSVGETEAILAIRDFLRRISYYSASQFSDPTKCPISFELEEDKPYRPGRHNVYHEKFMIDLYLTYRNNKKLFSKFLSTVNKLGIGIVDDITFAEYDMPSSSYEVKSGGKISRIERVRQLIIPGITIDSIQLSPNQLSEGTFKTLALIFYIITDDNDLLLIEEPEVCVHHGLLNSIISLILSQSSKKQIVISTHSDFVLDRLKPESLLIVKKMPKVGTTAKSLTKSLSKNDYAALKDYLAKTGNLGEYWKEGGFEDE